MEWGRAKTILIISFLFLNALLGYQLWVNKTNITGGQSGTSAMREETKQMLQSRGIRLEHEIPVETPMVRETIKFIYQLKGDERVVLPHPVDREIVSDPADFEEVLGDQIQHAEQYRLDPALGKAGVAVMNQLFENLPMFEINLKLYIEDDQIRAYKQSLVVVQSGNEGKKEQKVLSAYRVIRSLAEQNYLRSGSVIRDVRLGYHGQIYNSDTIVLFPKWRVVMDSGEIYYVHAINGAVEVQQKEQNP